MISTFKNLLQRFVKVPKMTFIIITINIVVFIYSRQNFHEYVLNYGLIPSQLNLGSLLSSCFLHDGTFHLVFNMSQLYIFGRGVERVMGATEFILFYAASCFISSATHALIVLITFPAYYSGQVVIGSSGAVAAIMGLYAVRYHRKIFNFFGFEMPVLLVIMLFTLIQLFFAVFGLYRSEFLGFGLRHVAFWSHIGGFTFGIGVALLANMALHGQRDYLIDLAKKEYNAGNTLESTQCYEQLIKYDPDNAEAYSELGRLWAILEEEEQSLPYYYVAIELYITQGKEEQAIILAKQMRQFWPESRVSEAIEFRLANYLEELGDTNQALSAFENIVERSPETIEAQMAMLKLGQLKSSILGDPASAYDILKRFVDIYPTSQWRSFAEENLKKLNARQIDIN